MYPLPYDSKAYVNQELGYTMRMNYSYTENFELHYHNYYEFFLTISNTVVHEINGQKQFLPSHSLVFVRPNDVHTYIKEGDFSFVNITFTVDTVEKLCSYLGSATDKILNSKMPPVILLDKNNYNHIMHRLNLLNTIDLNDKQQMQIKMKFILAEIFSYFINTALDKTDFSAPSWLSGLITTAKKPENINMTLDNMAELCKKSREHISRSFKKYYGTTVSEFMTEQKLNYCANLLLNTNLSVIDICFECGFQNASWFYRKFKQKFGVTPTLFRKNTSI